MYYLLCIIYYVLFIMYYYLCIIYYVLLFMFYLLCIVYFIIYYYCQFCTGARNGLLVLSIFMPGFISLDVCFSSILSLVSVSQMMTLHEGLSHYVEARGSFS